MEVDGQTIRITDGKDVRAFAVDEVIDSRTEQCTQAYVFKRVGGDLLEQSKKGYNICVFAYGHTGSGKTFTLLGITGGPPESQGLLPRFLKSIMEQKEKDSSKGGQFSAEYFEVYNETIRDLLAPAGTDKGRKVHVHPKHGVRVENLSTPVVHSPEEALGLLAFGNQMRAVATTTMNERSSRSHAVFTLRFNLPEEDVGDKQRTGYHNCESSITFVDLAGREDQEASMNRDQTFREMIYINTSLFHLTLLIKKLADGAVQKGSLSDFRNSKLTMLLSQGLIGNSRTVLLSTVAPLQAYFEDTTSTLQFAQSASKIRTKPVINNKSSIMVVKELEEEVRKLRKELAEAKVGGHSKESDLEAAQAMISYYKESFEEAISKTKENERSRRRMTMTLGLPSEFDGASEGKRTIESLLTPFLTKLTDDPALQGCCNFPIIKPVTCLGSDEGNCDIVLGGVGIRSTMCEICQIPHQRKLLIQLTQAAAEDSEATRVIINGAALQQKAQKSLTHGDSIFLGYAHAFRVIVPTQEMVEEVARSHNCDIANVTASMLARDSNTLLDMASAVREIHEETGVQFQGALGYLQHLSTRVPESTVKAFIRALHIVCPLVEEADLITREVFGEQNVLRIGVHILTNFLDYDNDTPELCVCVMRMEQKALNKFMGGVFSIIQEQKEQKEQKKQGPEAQATKSQRFSATLVGTDSPGNRSPRNARGSLLLLGKAMNPLAHALGLGDQMKMGKESILYVWSLEKFLRRLREMREVYHEGCEAKDGFEGVRRRLNAKPYINPWREMSLTDVDFILEDAGAVGARSSKEASKRLEPDKPFGLAEVVQMAMRTETGAPAKTGTTPPAPVAVAPVAPPIQGGGLSAVLAGLKTRPVVTPVVAPPKDEEAVITLKESQSKEVSGSSQKQGLPGPPRSSEGNVEHLPSWRSAVSKEQAIASSAKPGSLASQGLAFNGSEKSPPPSMGSQIRERGREAQQPQGEANSASAPPGYVPESTPTVSRRELDELKTELSTCRQETGKLFMEQSRLARLLDRFEGLVSNLTNGARQAQVPPPISARTSPPRWMGVAAGSPVGSGQRMVSPFRAQWQQTPTVSRESSLVSGSPLPCHRMQFPASHLMELPVPVQYGWAECRSPNRSPPPTRPGSPPPFGSPPEAARHIVQAAFVTAAATSTSPRSASARASVPRLEAMPSSSARPLSPFRSEQVFSPVPPPLPIMRNAQPPPPAGFHSPPPGPSFITFNGPLVYTPRERPQPAQQEAKVGTPPVPPYAAMPAMSGQPLQPGRTVLLPSGVTMSMPLQPQSSAPSLGAGSGSLAQSVPVYQLPAAPLRFAGPLVKVPVGTSSTYTGLPAFAMAGPSPPSTGPSTVTSAPGPVGSDATLSSMAVSHFVGQQSAGLSWRVQQSTEFAA